MSRYGVFGDTAIVPAYAASKYPDNLSPEEAAAIWMQYITAYGALVHHAKLAQGQTAMFTAATGGLGVAAIQMARQLGVTSIATTRSSGKRPLLESLQPDHVIVTGEEDIVERVKQITGGRGVDFVCDSVGGKDFPKLVDATAPPADHHLRRSGSRCGERHADAVAPPDVQGKRSVLVAACATALLGTVSYAAPQVKKNAKVPVVRISKGRFAPDRYDEVKRLIDQSATPLVPAIQKLRGLLYYHAAVDQVTSTVVNVSVWENLEAARQMDTLRPMLAQRPILEAAGVQFDQIANYEPAWKIEGSPGQSGIESITQPERSRSAAAEADAPVLPTNGPLDYAKRLFKAFDTPRLQRSFAHSFAPDGILRLGNIKPEVGRAVVLDGLTKLFNSVQVTHQVKGAWQDGGVIIVEADVTYALKVGKAATFPSLILIRLDARNLIASMFVAMDRSASHPLKDIPEAIP